MKLTITEILSYIDGQGLHPSYRGDGQAAVFGFSALSELKENTVTWIKDMKSFDIESTDDSLGILFITNEPYTGKKKYNILSCDDPKAGFFSVLTEFFAEKPSVEIAPTSTIRSKSIGEGVSIGYNCFIDASVTIGRGTVIRNNVVIEGDVGIGEDCVIESGTVIGAMGFGYYKTREGIPKKVPDFGGVRIGNRVGIGSNTCICRGTLADTIIDDDVKIDNLCHISHNVQIGKRCFVIALSEISGSVVIEEDVHIAPCASILNQLHIGKNAMVGFGSVVTKDVEDGTVVVGVPAKVLRDNK